MKNSHLTSPSRRLFFNVIACPCLLTLLHVCCMQEQKVMGPNPCFQLLASSLLMTNSAARANEGSLLRLPQFAQTKP